LLVQCDTGHAGDPAEALDVPVCGQAAAHLPLCHPGAAGSICSTHAPHPCVLAPGTQEHSKRRHAAGPRWPCVHNLLAVLFAIPDVLCDCSARGGARTGSRRSRGRWPPASASSASGAATCARRWAWPRRWAPGPGAAPSATAPCPPAAVPWARRCAGQYMGGKDVQGPPVDTSG
jgi:hypothetical protein